VSAISEVRFVESKSRQGLSTVRVWMNWGADVNDGQTEVIQRIQQILNTLPRDIKQPFIVRYDLSNIPVALITVSGGHLDERQLYDLAYNIIEPQVERLGGVASASVDGGKVRSTTRTSSCPPATSTWAASTTTSTRTTSSRSSGRWRTSSSGGRAPATRRSTSRTSAASSTRTRRRPRSFASTASGIPAGVHLGITLDQSVYIRQAIQSLWHEALQGSGLLVSTFFTLVLIPTLYVIFEERWPRTLVDEASEDVEPASDQPA
jgi:multidrug efflux pump subunit AcrB